MRLASHHGDEPPPDDGAIPRNGLAEVGCHDRE